MLRTAEDLAARQEVGRRWVTPGLRLGLGSPATRGRGPGQADFSAVGVNRTCNGDGTEISTGEASRTASARWLVALRDAVKGLC